MRFGFHKAADIPVTHVALDQLANLAINIADLADIGEKTSALSRDSADDAARTIGEAAQVAQVLERSVHLSEEMAESGRDLKQCTEELNRLLTNTELVGREAKAHAEKVEQQVENLEGVTHFITQSVSQIDEIARRTKLLSMNAQIEAARAGRAGVAFSVVAKEIAILSQLTDSTSSDVKHCIRDLSAAMRQVEEACIAQKTELESILAAFSAAVVQTTEQNRRVGETLGNIQSVKENTIEVGLQFEHLDRTIRDALASTKEITALTSSAAQHLKKLNGGLSAPLTVLMALSEKKLDRQYLQRGERLARKLEREIEKLVKAGVVSRQDLFDRSYVRIAGSDPAQYLTRYTVHFDRAIAPMQEAALAEPGIIACFLQDVNGYLPTHNEAYSKPPSKDPLWNAGNCRNRRMFDDPTSLAASRNTDRFLLQAYKRQLGKESMLVRDLSIPVHFLGEHWGCLRLFILPEQSGTAPSRAVPSRPRLAANGAS
jgi:methyl-accepting chemotaxis protein